MHAALRFFDVSDDWKKHEDTFCCHQGDFNKPSLVMTAVSGNFGNEWAPYHPPLLAGLLGACTINLWIGSDVA